MNKDSLKKVIICLQLIRPKFSLTLIYRHSITCLFQIYTEFSNNENYWKEGRLDLILFGILVSCSPIQKTPTLMSTSKEPIDLCVDISFFMLSILTVSY